MTKNKRGTFARKLPPIFGACLGVVLAGHANASLEGSNVYVNSAKQMEAKDDLRGAEIQLRNAVEQSPNSGAIRLELAKVYLMLGNPRAAQAELAVARQNGVKEEFIAPLLAEALMQAGDFGNLLRDVPAGARPPKIESVVRTYRAAAAMSLGETAAAGAMLKDAERLDPTSALPKITAARMFLIQKQYKAAEFKINQALRINPRDSNALEVKGQALLLQGNQAAALRQFNAAIALHPHNVQALLDRANVEITRNQIQPAQDDLRTVQAIAPNVVMGTYLTALVDAKLANFKDADTALEKLRPVMDKFPDAYFLAGEVKYKLNQFAQAENYLIKFIAQRQDQPKAFEILGVLALRRGETDRAVSMLEKAHALIPNDLGAASLLGQAYLAHGESRKAQDLMDRTAALHPASNAALSQRALTHFAAGDTHADISELSDLFKKGDFAVAPPLILAQMRAGNLAEAAVTAELMAKRDPSNLLIQELLGTVRAAQHNYGAAEIVFKNLLAKKPSLTAARHNLAQVYLATNRGDIAVKLFADWLAAHPDDVGAQIALADVYVQRKDLKSAIGLLQRAQSSAKDPLAGLELVQIYQHQHDWPDAEKTAQDIRSKFQGSMAAWDALARVYLEAGELTASAATYKEATAHFPNSADIWKNYGIVLIRSKNLPDALIALTRSLALQPDDTGLQSAVVDLTYQTKGLGAAQSVAQSFAGNSHEPIVALLTAAALYKNSKQDDAIALLQASQKTAPSPLVALTIAKYYEKNGQALKAIAALEEWTRSHPDDVTARFGLAQLYGASGNMQAALVQFEWLATKRPSDPLVLNNLAWLYSQKNDPKARQVAEKAFSLAPKSGDIADTLGWIAVQKGDAVAGVKYLETANILSPNNGTAKLHLAIGLIAIHRSAEARVMLQALLKSNESGDLKKAAQAELTKIGG